MTSAGRSRMPLRSGGFALRTGPHLLADDVRGDQLRGERIFEARPRCDVLDEGITPGAVRL